MRKPFVRGLVLAIVAGVALVAICAACPLSHSLALRPLLAQTGPRYVSSGVEPMPFDGKRWRSGTGNQKLAMAKWLEQTAALEGQTRDELVEMLGEPDIEKPGDEVVRWLIGFYAKGLFDEARWLAVTVKKDGQAAGAIVWTDWNDLRR